MRCTVLFLLMMLSSIAVAEPVATVIRTEGAVTLTAEDGQQAPLLRQDTLVEGDQLSTGDESTVTLRFNDNTLVKLDAQSELVITSYQPASPDESRFFLELLNGRLRLLTGTLANEPSAFELRTPHASIGVRGTEFEVRVVSELETRVRQLQGRVLVRSLEFQGQILTLSTEAPLATISLDTPAQPITVDTIAPMPPFAAGLLAPEPEVPAVLPLAAATPANTDAALPDPMTTLIALVNEQQWQAARVVADELQERFEGLPRYDLYTGLIQMQEGAYDEAIFSFERVLIFEPNQHRARLELGRAYYLTGNFYRAREALQQVLAVDPPQGVRQRVQLILNRIDQAERRQQIQTHVGGTLLMGWDSNANTGSQLNGPLDSNLLNLTELTEASRAISSPYLQWTFATGAYEPTSQRSGRQFSVEFSNKNFINDALPDSSALAVTGQILQQSDRWRTRLPVNAQWSWLNGQSWSTGVNLSVSEQFNIWGPLWAGVKIGTEISVGLHDSSDTTVKDLAGLVFDVQERGRVHTLSSTYLRHRQAGQDDEHVEWSALSNEYRLSGTVVWKLQGAFSAEHQWRYYRGDDLLFTVDDESTTRKRRQDQVLSLDAQLSWPAADWLLVLSNLGWEIVDSNINAYSRNRLVISQAVRLRF
ncbi:iron dicitrate transport regulator FecR [Reinekea blandensis]|uniref:Protein containing tetratricopeptide repeat n=1 Tax=Reinekea blandensis MED297 TaxID=314283 RepID=A4BBX0_9GAMM|nr:iron dicitrate transport regulator FecR [Reinekea blandensis]EAR10455.1 protein containing tetratricopeptide repeat [Reinekea sp. MED297] [Reinekea blandensis MED297]